MTERSRGLLLLPLALAMAVLAIFHAVILPLTPVRMDRASAELIPASGLWSALADLPWPVPMDGATLGLSLLAVAGVGFGAYGLAVAAAWGQPATRRSLALVLVPAAFFLTISAIALPTQSSDVVDYLLSGRVAAVHGANPYTAVPDDFADDPLLPYASGTYTSDPEAKPPVWIGIAVIAATITRDMAPADAVLTARFLFLAMTATTAAILAVTLRRWRPQHLLAGLVLYTWSPIVILHGQAKFDTPMALFAVLAGAFLVLERPFASLAALWLSVLVKLLSLPLVAVSALGEMVAGRWRRVVLGAGLITVLTIALYLPLGGPTWFIDHLLLAGDAGGTLPRIVSLGLLAIAGLLALWGGWRSRGEIEATLQGWGLAAIGVVLVAPLPWSWYRIMPIAVIALTGERWKTLIVIVASAVSFAIDTWVRSTNATYPLEAPFGLSRGDAAVIAIGAIAVVAAGLAAASIIRRRRPPAAASPIG